MSKHYQTTVYHQSKYFPQHPPHLSPPMSAAPGCTAERMCRLKGSLEPQWHCILYHRGVWCNCRAEGLCNPCWRYKQFEVSRRPKHSEDKRHHYACWGIINLLFLYMRLQSCSIRAFSVISHGSWSHFSLLIISQASAMESVYGLCTFKYALSYTVLLYVTDSELINNNGLLHLSHQYAGSTPQYRLISALGAHTKMIFIFKHWLKIDCFGQWE